MICESFIPAVQTAILKKKEDASYGPGGISPLS